MVNFVARLMAGVAGMAAFRATRPVKTVIGKKSVGWLGGLLAVSLLISACAPGVPAAQVAAKDQEIANLKAQLAELQTDSKFWQQLTALMTPVELPSMTDHRAYMLPSGVILALHFDHLDLQKAQNLNWVALGIPGKFCKEDQERIEKEFGPGFTHFHDLKNDTHGGAPGAEGVWFVHIAVRDFEAPWGAVKAGVDEAFMPTPAPEC